MNPTQKVAEKRQSRRPTTEEISHAETIARTYGLVLLARDHAGCVPTEAQVIRMYRRLYPTGPLSTAELVRRIREVSALGIAEVVVAGKGKD